MFLTEKALAKCESLYSSGDYKVVLNPLGNNFTEENWKKEEQQANYLVVNTKTRAIEFAIDQLPSAAEICRRLDSDLNPEAKEPIKIPRYDIQ